MHSKRFVNVLISVTEGRLNAKIIKYAEAEVSELLILMFIVV